ncbi:MAG: PRC-barrel domain-containing protein [Trueperaceae bacterium]|nr:PRC-barrel domain-containing protein [Trueperaceae bacterium]
MSDHTDRTPSATLVRLSEERLHVEHPSEDVRGHSVLDRNDEEIGTVEDLLVDDHERKVRFLEVSSGGFLGIGAKTFHIPVDAVTRIHDDHVHVDMTREHVGQGPSFDPDVVVDESGDERGYYEGVYRHYGHSPFWGPGYAYPAFPFIGR